MDGAIRFNNSTTSVATAPAPTTHVGAHCQFIRVAADTNAFSSVQQVREGGGNDGDQLSCGSTGTDLLWIDYPTTGEIAIANLTVGQWYFVAVNRFATAVEIYLGVPGMAGWITHIRDATPGTFTPSELSWGVWSGSGLGDTFDGNVCGAKYWVGSHLSQSEWAKEMQSIDPVCRANLWGAWRFNNKTDGLLDLSGRGNHAVLGAGTITIDPGPDSVRRRRVSNPYLVATAVAPSSNTKYFFACA